MSRWESRDVVTDSEFGGVREALSPRSIMRDEASVLKSGGVREELNLKSVTRAEISAWEIEAVVWGDGSCGKNSCILKFGKLYASALMTGGMRTSTRWTSPHYKSRRVAQDQFLSALVLSIRRENFSHALAWSQPSLIPVLKSWVRDVRILFGSRS